MKPLYPLLLLLLAATASTQAQSSRALQPYSDGKWVVKFNLLSWLDPETPTLQPGIEYRLNKRSSVEFTVGIPTRIYDYTKPTDTTYNRYFKMKSELKYFPGEKRSFYIGPEVSFISKKKSRYNASFEGDDGKTYGYDYAQIEKSIVTLAFKFGFVMPLKGNNRWLLDTYFGAGPRFGFMNVDAVNVQPGGHGPLFWQTDREGFTTSIHVTMGLRLAYILH